MENPKFTVVDKSPDSEKFNWCEGNQLLIAISHLENLTTLFFKKIILFSICPINKADKTEKFSDFLLEKNRRIKNLQKN